MPDPLFTPPEGSAPTVAADLFGTAATLCFAATGLTLPSSQALEVAAPRLPTPLVDTLRMCLDPDAHDRPHSVGALLRTVEALRAGTLDWGERPEPEGLAAGPTANLGPGRAPTPPAQPTRPERVSSRPAPASGEPVSGLRPRRPSALIEPPSVDEAPPTPAALAARFPEPAASAPAAPASDISAMETLPPPTSPDAPPMPVRTADLPVAFSFGRHEADANAPGLEALDLQLESRGETTPDARPEPRPEPRPEARPDERPRWTPEEAPREAAELRPAPAVRRPPPQVTTAAVEPPASKALWLGAGGVLAVGIAGVVAWSLLRSPPPPLVSPPPAAADAARAAPASADAEAGSDAADPPSPLPRQSYVVVIPDPGPARFVQVP
ncbi:MAG: hypothetical protein R3F60_34000, partial [bacterium]